MAQPARLEVERLVLSRREARVVNLLDHVAQVVRPAAHLVPPLRQRLFLAAQLLGGVPRLGECGALRPRPAELVEDISLRLGVEQRLGLVLAVQIHQEGAQPCEGPDRRGAAVDPGAGAPVGTDLAADHQAVVLGLDPQLLHPAAERGVADFQRPFHHRPLGPGADLGAVGAGPEQERDGIHQHGLAGPGLAGEGIEAGAEGERHVRDGDQIADPEFGDHRTASRSERSPQLSFWRMRVK